MDWEVGKHGLTIHFNEVQNDGKDMGATYLPHVASGAGWNQLQTLDHLVEKAGHKGKYVDIKNNLTQAERYQSIIFEMTYDEY